MLPRGVPADSSRQDFLRRKIVRKTISFGKNFGKEIKELRLQRKMTQIELSRKCGLKQNYISGIENGKINPGVDTASKILAALEVEVTLN